MTGFTSFARHGKNQEIQPIFVTETSRICHGHNHHGFYQILPALVFDRHGFYQRPTRTTIAIIYLFFLHIEDAPIFSFQERFGSQRQFLIDSLGDAISIYLFSVILAIN